MDRIFVNALETAARCQCEVGLILATGVAAASTSILTPDNLVPLSKFHLNYLMPALILRLHEGFTLARLKAWGTVSIVAVVHVALGALLGWLGGRVLRLNSQRRRILVLTTAFGNSAAMPFILIAPITLSWSVTRDDPDAQKTAYAAIGLYLAAWFVAFFSAGTAFASSFSSPSALGLLDDDSAIAALAPGEGTPVARDGELPRAELPSTLVNDASVAPRSTSHWQTCPGSLWRLARSVNPVLYYMLASVVIGCSPLRDALTPKGPLSPLSNMWVKCGDAGVVLSTVVLGAGLMNTLRGSKGGKTRNSTTVSGTGTAGRSASTGTGGMELDVVQQAMVQQTPLSRPGKGGDTAFIALACVLRLLVLPLLCLPLNMGAMATGLLPENPTLLMVLTISAGTPSAQTLVVLLNANGATAASAECTKVYVPMYAFSILSVSLLIVAVCVLIGGMDNDPHAAPVGTVDGVAPQYANSTGNFIQGA